MEAAEVSMTSAQDPVPISISTSLPALVLITGCTGHIGFRVLLLALSAGYTVRAAVRSSSKSSSLLSHPKILSLPPETRKRLSFIIVPDLTVRNAYDEAVKGVHYIIHIASPLMSEALPGEKIDYDETFIKPAVRGTLEMLESARREKGVKRVVITSSITAIIPYEELVGEKKSGRWVEGSDRIPFQPGPYTNEFEAYAASKVAALNEAELWLKDREKEAEGVEFDVVFLHPSFVEGRNDLAMTPREVMKGTNAIILGIALGQTFTSSTAGTSILLEDTARCHVLALNTSRVKAKSYILTSSEQTVWDDVSDIVQREFGEEVERGILSKEGGARTHALFLDAEESESVFGPFAGLRGQVTSVVGHYLELRERSGKMISLRRG